MLYILPEIGRATALYASIKAAATEADYPITKNPDSASLFIGNIHDAFPVSTPQENIIILKDPDVADTVLTRAHLFSYFTLTGIDTRESLSSFLKKRTP